MSDPDPEDRDDARGDEADERDAEAAEGEEREREKRGGPPSGDRVRLELVLFAEMIHRLEESGTLLEAVPFLLTRLGDLRRVLFDYEVRVTERLLPIEDPREREARRILREIEERKREMIEEWGRGWEPEGSEGSEESGGDGGASGGEGGQGGEGGTMPPEEPPSGGEPPGGDSPDGPPDDDVA